MRGRLLLAVVLCGCPSQAASKHTAPPPSPRDPDEGACASLCARERACDASVDVAQCATACEKDRARMKPGFIAAYAKCYDERLASCAGKDIVKLRDEAHLHCFDAALAGFPRDDDNQRDMAESVCARGERCQGIGKAGHDACMQATLAPKEPEVKLGQRLVDGLRRARVIAFRKCLDAKPCAKPDTFDAAVNDCYEKSISNPEKLE